MSMPSMIICCILALVLAFFIMKCYKVLYEDDDKVLAIALSLECLSLFTLFYWICDTLTIENDRILWAISIEISLLAVLLTW